MDFFNIIIVIKLQNTEMPGNQARLNTEHFFCRVTVRTDVTVGDRGSTVVKVLCYKSEGRWFDPS